MTDYKVRNSTYVAPSAGASAKSKIHGAPDKQPMFVRPATDGHCFSGIRRRMFGPTAAPLAAVANSNAQAHYAQLDHPATRQANAAQEISARYWTAKHEFVIHPPVTQGHGARLPNAATVRWAQENQSVLQQLRTMPNYAGEFHEDPNFRGVFNGYF